MSPLLFSDSLYLWVGKLEYFLPCFLVLVIGKQSITHSLMKLPPLLRYKPASYNPYTIKLLTLVYSLWFTHSTLFSGILASAILTFLCFPKTYQSHSCLEDSVYSGSMLAVFSLPICLLCLHRQLSLSAKPVVIFFSPSLSTLNKVSISQGLSKKQMACPN